MAKVTILRTNKGTKILGTMQCSNGAYVLSMKGDK